MKQVAVVILLILFGNPSLIAQYISPNVIDPQDTIIVDLDIDKGISYSHIVKPKQTIYSISRFFNIDINSLYAINGLNSSDMIDPGQILLIPMDMKVIDTEVSQGIPVAYLVKPKETLYRISKIYFDQEVTSIVSRNNLSGFDLNVGQKIIIGYFNPNKTIPAVKEIHSDTLNTYSNSENIPEFNIENDSSLVRRRYSEKSVAIWDKSASDQQSAFVLHQNAKPGSYIEIYNPVVRRKTVALVVGNLPEGLYPDDVDMVMSPLVAKTLGALDSRTMVELTYEY